LRARLRLIRRDRNTNVSAHANRRTLFGASALWRDADHEIVDQPRGLSSSTQKPSSLYRAVSANYVYYPMVSGALLDQLWVR
jgi:hypothetical protein